MLIIPGCLCFHLALMFWSDSNPYLWQGIYVGWQQTLLALSLLLCAWAGTMLSAHTFNAETTRAVTAFNFILFEVAFWLALTGYLVWFGELLLNPAMLLDVLRGELGAVYLIRPTFKTIPGLTTLAQLGICYSALYFFYLSRHGHIPVRYTIYFIILLAFAIMRVFAWSERLALIEILLPWGVYFFLSLSNRSGKVRVFIFFLPFIAIILMIVFFGIGEYFRSWINFYSYHQDSFWVFILERISSYYLNALNNGAVLIQFTKSEGPIFSFIWLYRFPVIGGWFGDTQDATDISTAVLTYYGTPEMNNISAIYTVYYDWRSLSFVLFAFLGFITHRAYLLFRLGDVRAAIIFPCLYLTLMELMRINYGIETRIIPVYGFFLLYFFREKLFRKNN